MREIGDRKAVILLKTTLSRVLVRNVIREWSVILHKGVFEGRVFLSGWVTQVCLNVAGKGPVVKDALMMYVNGWASYGCIHL